ncbi:hypothetical protein FIBSPDRAFT_980383 [Athelia psychrophila]|uniref:Uncharacterized protein n=1 Tax=Athelia psychrophila TaxID=1759441 RepID=A0A166D7Q8_9AGAM|nr:hypothetical protein FIBSPDRAFT_980383 [Fibularhizoctonia sp. CBS 109695]
MIYWNGEFFLVVVLGCIGRYITGGCVRSEQVPLVFLGDPRTAGLKATRCEDERIDEHVLASSWTSTGHCDSRDEGRQLARGDSRKAIQRTVDSKSQSTGIHGEFMPENKIDVDKENRMQLPSAGWFDLQSFDAHPS